MTYSFSLISNLHVSLVIWFSSRSPYIQEKSCKIEISPVACYPVQLNKPHFNNLVTRVDLYPVPSEIAADQVSRFDGNIEQGSFSGRLVMCSCSFIKMSEVI